MTKLEKLSETIPRFDSLQHFKKVQLLQNSQPVGACKKFVFKSGKNVNYYTYNLLFNCL